MVLDRCSHCKYFGEMKRTNEGLRCSKCKKHTVPSGGEAKTPIWRYCLKLEDYIVREVCAEKKDDNCGGCAYY